MTNDENPFYRSFMALDSWMSTAGFEIVDFIQLSWSAYSSWLEHFRIGGLARIAVDLIDDALTLGMGVAVIVAVVAIPPFNNTGDIWNQGRQYAVTFTDQNGEIIGRRGIRQDDAVPIEEIPPHVIHAVLATEDARFYDHFGIDLQGLVRAVVVNAQANEVVQGGSTLTQQLAKNLFLSPERSLKRKIHEAFLALWIESRLTKDQILKMYLDRSYLGGGNYGVEAAAQYYFGKSIRDVNLSEAAILGGLFKAPSNYAPHVNAEAAKARANVVLYRMLDVGFISQAELFEAKQHPAEVVNQAAYYSPDWFLDWAYKETLDVINEQNLTNEYVIEVKTTIDVGMQKAAQRIINEKLETEAPAYRATQAALVAMTPDGAVRAIVGGKDYEASQFNRATDALRQPGSSFKPFVYLAALKAGFKPTSIVYDAPVSVGNWTPKNYTLKYAGRTTLTNALAHSYNSVPVHLMLQIGRKAIIDTAHECGLKSNLLSIPSLPLGTNEVTLLDITTGYATFANSGKLAMPHTLLEIRRPTGELLYSREANAPPPKQVEPLDKIADLNTMMNQVVVAGTGQRAFLGFTPQAGKTGTNQSYRDAWFIGFTGHLVAGVWFGNDDFKDMKKMTGGTVPAGTWHDFMVEALAGKAPVALAGLPVEESHIKLAAANQKPTGDTAMADEAQPDESAPPAEAGQSAPSDALAAADAALAEGQGDDTDEPQKSDAVGGILQDMFTLFRQQPVQKTRQQVERKRVRQAAPQQVVQRQARPRDGGLFFFDGFGRSSNFSSRFGRRDWTNQR
jgi:penicillin-binding protein 1A